jgi:5-methylcytosine-specific restriction endonuclease McrA
MAEGLKTLIDKYALTDRFIVDIIKVELISTKKNNTKRKRTHVPRGLRKEVFKRDGYKCVECGARRDDGATLHVDHKIPVSKGGTDELDNLQTLCSDCNLNKSDVIQ